MICNTIIFTYWTIVKFTTRQYILISDNDAPRLNEFIRWFQISFKIMIDLCLICGKSISEGNSVNVVHGLKSLKTASIERNDGHIDFLNTIITVNVNVECRVVYFSKNSIVESK